MKTTEMCHCGQPLHYLSVEASRLTEDLIRTRGTHVLVTVDGRTWRVPRHYIALHGLKAWEIHALGFDEVAR